MRYPRLDITDDESIQSLVELVKRQEGDGVDVVINNAGVNVDGKYSLENVKLTLKTNYEGTLKVRLPLMESGAQQEANTMRQMNQAFLPLVRANNGRIVNLSSVGSQLKPYSETIQSVFRAVKSLQEIQALADEYVVRGSWALGLPSELVTSC